MDVSTNDNLHEKVNVSLLKHALHFTTSFVHYTGCAVTRGQRTGPQVKRSGCETWLSHLVVFLGKVLKPHSVFLSNQDNKWVRANSLVAVARDRLESHPSLHAIKTGISSGQMVGALGSIAPFTFVYDSFFLSLNSTLDRMLDHLLLEEEKAIPLRMPSPEEYW